METIANLLPNWHWYYLMSLPGLLIGFTVHELGHSLTAYFLGDRSQVKRGSISANPLRHISWLGTALFLLFGIGWPKPLRFDARPFKDRYLDSLLVAIAGPVASFAASVVVFLSSALLVSVLSASGRISGEQASAVFFFNRSHPLAHLTLSEAMQNATVWLVVFTNRIWVVNFVLAVISLIPLPPFDGFTATLSLLGHIKELRIKQLTGETPPPALLESRMIEPASNPGKKQTIAEIHFKLGAEYHRQQKFDDAIARYRLALQADSTFGPAYVNMGLAYKATNRREEAIHAFRGATRYASDEKSKAQAWAELQSLNALPDAPPPLHPPAPQSGAIPWTDVGPSPDWLAFWAGLIALLILFSCPLSLLLTGLLGGS